MTPLSADGLRRLEEHLVALERSLAKIGPEAGAGLSRDLVETQEALRRVEKGTYGRCESCGGAIGRQRLLALPATRYCIACASTASAVGR